MNDLCYNNLKQVALTLNQYTMALLADRRRGGCDERTAMDRGFSSISDAPVLIYQASCVR